MLIPVVWSDIFGGLQSIFSITAMPAMLALIIGSLVIERVLNGFRKLL